MRDRLALPGAFLVLFACSHCDGPRSNLPIADSAHTPPAPAPAVSPSAASSASPSPSAAAAQPASSGDPAAFARGVQVVEKREAYTTHGGKCTVEVTVPSVSGLADAAAEAKANQRLRDRLFDGISQDCRTGRDPQPARTSGRCADLPPQGTTEVVAGYRIGVIHGDLLSLRHHRTDCSNPSLHPNDVSGGLTMDLRRDVVYSLEDLFRPGSGWERLLLSLVQRDLKQKQPDLSVKKLESRDYYLTDRAIVLMNLVPARAFHALEVQIPFDDVQGILREDGPVNALRRGLKTKPGEQRSPSKQP